MLEADLPDLAVRGSRGIDIFRRHDDAGQKRVRYECLATFAAGPEDEVHDALPLQRHNPAVNPARMRAALARFRETPALHLSFTLSDSRSYPALADPRNRLALFHYLDFLRARSVACIAVEAFAARVREAPDPAARHFADTQQALKLMADFNLLEQAEALCPVLSPRVIARLDAPAFAEDSSQSTGFSLRLLGDLWLRLDKASQALPCFEAAVRAGDNPFRRRKAIEAAHAAGDDQALRRHLDALARRGALPADLAALAGTQS